MQRFDFDQEINAEKRFELKDHKEYMDKFTLSPYNLLKFREEIESTIRALDNEVRTNTDVFFQFYEEVSLEKKRPDLRGGNWGDDPWLKICKKMEDIIRLLIRINAYKSWEIRHFVVSHNKLVEYAMNLSDDLLNLKKVEAERDGVKEKVALLQDLLKMVNESKSCPQMSIADAVQQMVNDLVETVSGINKEILDLRVLVSQKNKNQQALLAAAEPKPPPSSEDPYSQGTVREPTRYC